MQFSVSYIFRLIDQFTPGAGVLAAAAGKIKGAMAAAGASAAGLARSMALVGGAVAIAGAAFVLSGVKQAAAFEESLTGVRRVADITREEMLDLGRDALKIGVTTGQTGSDVADMMKQAAMMGIRGRPALNAFAETVAKVAVAWDDVNIEEAAGQLARMSVKFFGDKSPEEQARRIRDVADAINELSNRSAFKAPELLKFYDNASAGAARFGLTAEQTAAWGGTALVVDQPSGLRQGYRAQAAFLRLQNAATNANKKQVVAFRELGTSAKEFGQMMEQDAQGALMFLLEKAAKLPTMERGGVLGRLLGNMDASRQVAAIADNLNEYKRQLAIVDDEWAQKLIGDAAFMDWLRNAGEGHRELADQLDRYGRVATRHGSVQREFQKRTESLNFSLKAMGLAYDRIKILLALPLLSPFRSFANGVTDALSSLGDFVEKNEQLGAYLSSGGAVAGLIGVGAALVKLAVYATGAASAWTLLAGLGMVTLKLTLLAVGVAAAMWIYDNWNRLVEYASTPITFKIAFPEAPAWLQWIMGNAEKNSQAAMSGANDFRDKFKNWATGNGWELPPIDVPQDGAAGPQSSLTPGAIPQSVSVSTRIEPIQLQAGQLNIQYNGPLQGPPSVSVGGSAPRGTSTVEGGSAAPAGAN